MKISPRTSLDFLQSLERCHDDDTENDADATDEETADEDAQENNKRKKVNRERGNEKRVHRISNSVVETIALRQEREERNVSVYERRRRNMLELDQGLRALEEGELDD